MRKGFNHHCKNNKVRNRRYKSNKKDLLKWKKKRRYGHIWMMIETLILDYDLVLEIIITYY
ncbi:MAG TPA: hypothetical protein VN703_08510 [Candidatus Sulfopaludibacter sp.]|jgi:hypothetical protein|nr:hypothetical protein [Candidatus Sulfopaludibacter sp.]